MSVTRATVSCLSCMGDELDTLVLQNHIKSQNPSLPHPTDTLLVSEPQKEMQLKTERDFLKGAASQWPNVVVNRIGNTSIKQPQLASHLRQAPAFVWQAMLGSAHKAVDIQTCRVCTQAVDRHPDKTRCNSALTAPQISLSGAVCAHAVYLFCTSKLQPSWSRH